MVTKEIPQRSLSKIGLGHGNTFSKSQDWSPREIVHEEEWAAFPLQPIFDFTLGGLKHDIFDDIIYRNPPIRTSLGSFFIDDKIENIYSTIIESQTLREYRDDWDAEGAIGFNELVYDRAINLLIKYSEYALSEFDLSISSPEINMGRDGSIDLEWRHNNNILLLNILNCNDFSAHYYGHDISSDTIIKGSLSSFNINKVLAFWMKCLV